MTIIKKLTQEQFEDLYQLNVYAFHFKDTDDVKERMRNEFEYGLSFGAFSGDQLTSSLIVLPLEVYYQGTILKMGGIGNVTSYPEARGKGSIRRLMETALTEMKEQGIVVSYLAPFSYHFYRKFGYEVSFEKRQFDIKPGDFGSFEAPETRVDRVLWEDQKEAIKAIYHKKMEEAIGPVKRKEWEWEKRNMSSGKKKLALFQDDNEAPQGYLLYEFSGENQNTFQIDELTALTGTAEKALWEFIGTHAAGFDKFIYTGRADQHLTHLFKEADLDQKMASSMMARIVDMENFLRQYPFKRNENQEFLLEVTDDTAKWNEKLYRLSIKGQEVTLSIVDQPDDNAHKLKANIQTWTQLFMQFKKAGALQFEGSLSTSKETAHAFQTILPEGVPELHDFF
ncbi:GNAT family N-acetyltransferase [Alkalibacterium olivapovliticus]|uniref:Putative acetyltransferase n=1 Tax=Alkalibacterium olivapovliticus TaxID=99907 RepID=A0A2T0W7B6_9LACT|nr:GNAT family N-acetyltransferase [Alkalibacterium olivapovliticus]PRY82600.1 putative acetyltransferase [Alkalibacterium olivapovliticus]